MMKGYFPQLGADGEGHGDKVVEDGFVFGLAELTLIAVVDPIDATKALHHA